MVFTHQRNSSRISVRVSSKLMYITESNGLFSQLIRIWCKDKMSLSTLLALGKKKVELLELLSLVKRLDAERKLFDFNLMFLLAVVLI